MLKFWKKKPDDTTAATPDAAAVPDTPPETGTDAPRGLDSASELEAGEPVLGEALAETPMASTPAAATEPPETPPPSPRRRGWRERLAGSGFARSLAGVFNRHPKLDDDLLDELETVLLTSDVGVDATTTLIDDLRQRMKKREFADADALLQALRAALVAMLAPVEQPLQITAHTPFVILTVGVNGVGKTTTIGKLAYLQRDQGRRVMLAAGDTFRAAAVEQLKTWGQRNGVPVIAQGQGADSASVIFDAVQGAQARGVEVLIADTAGRLHTQGGLMNELGKIARVLRKIDDTAPHEVLMVIDGTTGQNAVNQVRQFGQSVPITGLVVTKLDGTAKGGVVFALAREFGLPIRYVGLGEQIADLRRFDAEAFVDGLLPARLGD